MGCDDVYEPLTPEQNRRVEEMVAQRQRQEEERIKGYEDEIRRIVNRGTITQFSEIYAIICEQHRPWETEVNRAWQNLAFSNEFTMDHDLRLKPIDITE